MIEEEEESSSSSDKSSDKSSEDSGGLSQINKLSRADSMSNTGPASMARTSRDRTNSILFVSRKSRNRQGSILSAHHNRGSDDDDDTGLMGIPVDEMTRKISVARKTVVGINNTLQLPMRGLRTRNAVVLNESDNSSMPSGLKRTKNKKDHKSKGSSSRRGS